MNTKVQQIEKIKPASIHDLIAPEFFFELGTRHDEYLKSAGYYEYYYAISKFYQPKSILEIGVRYGYSLGSMIKGCDTVKQVVGIDIDDYESNSLRIAEDNIKKYINSKIDYNFYLQDSHTIEKLPQFYDLIHIDGDHTYEGKVQDLNLTIGQCKVLIVDDYNMISEVNRAANDWLEANKSFISDSYVINSIRGTLVVEMK